MEGFDIGQSFEDALTRLFSFLPEIVAALLLLLIGYIIAKILASVTRRLLQKARFDRAMHASAAGNYISRLVESPSRFAGKVVYWLVFLLFASMAATALHLPLLNQIVQGVFSYIPRIIASILIFLVASAISAGTAKFIQRVMGRTATAKLITTIVPVVTMSIAGFMILNQLNIAKDIVNILFTAIVGAIALGMALAFGLGGREVAQDLLQKAYDTGRENVAEAKSDVERAAVNARAVAREERAKRGI